MEGQISKFLEEVNVLIFLGAFITKRMFAEKVRSKISRANSHENNSIKRSPSTKIAPVEQAPPVNEPFQEDQNMVLEFSNKSPPKTSISIRELVFSNHTYTNTNYRLQMKVYEENRLFRIGIAKEQRRVHLQIKNQFLHTRYFDVDAEEKKIVMKVNHIWVRNQDGQGIRYNEIPRQNQPSQIYDIVVYPEHFQFTINYLMECGYVSKPNLEKKQPINCRAKEKKLQSIKDSEVINLNHINFEPPNSQRRKSIDETKQKLRKLKREEKEEILIDVYKIKKHKKEGQGYFFCPIHDCGRKFTNPTYLEHHVKYKHPELEKNGIEINDGKFTYTNKALDLVLYLGKQYPDEMKKIIKRMKIIQK